MEPAADAPGAPRTAEGGDEVRLGSAVLYCETCGEETPHRIFRVRRPAGGGRGTLEGVARCRNCRTTHPFESRPEGRTELRLIVSDGPRSERRALHIAPETMIRVGAPLPGPEEGLLVRKVDAADGRVRGGGRADELRTVWATRDVGAVVKVSVIEGRRTTPERLVVPPETVFEVGGTVRVAGAPLTVTALRARGRTWRLPGDAFPASDVQRLYGRRTAIPPAGRSDWRSERSMPSSRTSSSSRTDRSRSSPGASSRRTSPRTRTDAGGATVHRSWSW